MTTAAELASYASSFPSFRNRIINGDMRIDQRGAISVTPSGGATSLACDRFKLQDYWSSGQVNTSKSTVAPTGFTNSLLLTVTTSVPMSGSTGYFASLYQSIEGFNIANAYTSTITLSFWVRSSINDTYSVTFANDSLPNVGSNNRIYVVNYEIDEPNTWEHKTITVDLAAGVAAGTWNTENLAGLCVSWNLGAESNRKGNDALGSWLTLSNSYPFQSASQTNWISTSGATFYITGVQLEVGTVATPFEHRPIGTELALCQRYYEKSTELTEQFPLYKAREADRLRLGTIQYKVTKRATPSIILLGANGDGGGTPSSASIGIYAFRIFSTATSDTSSPYVNGYSAEAEL